MSVNRLGMSLLRMGSSAESVRFLDDVDLTFSIDSRTSSSQQMTSIEIASKPITFRASYRDINLITSIVNKAVERYGNSQQTLINQRHGNTQSPDAISKGPEASSSLSQKSETNRLQHNGKGRVLMSKEVVSLFTLGLLMHHNTNILPPVERLIRWV